VNQVLVKVIAVEDQNRLPAGTLQRSLQAIAPERESTKLRGLSALRMTRTNRDESLRVLLRLLIDESVEDLSRAATDARHCQERRVKRRKRFRPYWACAPVMTSTLPSMFCLK
jgi:hypothetical protein